MRRPSLLVLLDTGWRPWRDDFLEGGKEGPTARGRLPGRQRDPLGLPRLDRQGARGPAERHREEARLVAEIRTMHTDSHGTYGGPRVHAEPRRRGQTVNHKRGAADAPHGIVGWRPRRRRGLTKPDTTAAPAPDLVARLVAPDQPEVAWCGDLTWIPTEEGWLYLASVLDLASRRLLGWSMGIHHHAQLVCDALDAAVATRGRRRMPDTILHTNRGAEYTSHACIDASPSGASPLGEPHGLVPGLR